jgi:hypothetical protein
MRKFSSWILAGAMATGFSAVPFAALAGAGTNDPAANHSADTDAPLALPGGFAQKNVDSIGEVRTGLEKLTERFATKGDFNKMLAELTDQDKDRAREFKGVDQNKIDGEIALISQSWKSKYGADFDLNDKNVVFDDRYVIVQGEVTDPPVALAGWPVASTPGAVTAGSKQTPADAGDKAVQNEVDAAKLDKGRNVALVRVPGSDCLPSITVSMIHELPMFYRVDVPNDRTGEQIYNDTLTQLTYIAQHTDKWPADVNDAYRMIAHHAAAAVYGVDLNKLAAASIR